MRTEALLRAEETRPFFTCFPDLGDPHRYLSMAAQVGSRLFHVDRELQVIAKLGRTEPHSGNLTGHFRYSAFMRFPGDNLELQSFWKMYEAGPALNLTAAAPGTRLEEVRAEGLLWCAVARALVMLLCNAKAKEAVHLGSGYARFYKLQYEARLFAQVAALHLTPLFGGPSTFDFGGMARWMERSEGIPWRSLIGPPICLDLLAELVTRLDRGELFLKDILSRHWVKHDWRFMEAMDFVVDGGFNLDLARYDHLPTRADPALRSRYTPAKSHPHRERLGVLKSFPPVQAYYSLLDLNGDGSIHGAELQAALSCLHDFLNLMLSGAVPGPNAPAVLRRHFEHHDLGPTGLYTTEDVNRFLRTIRPFLEALKLDQPAAAKVKLRYGPKPRLQELDVDSAAQCPVLVRLFEARSLLDG